MPTVFTWPYIGGKDDSEEATFRGELASSVATLPTRSLMMSWERARWLAWQGYGEVVILVLLCRRRSSCAGGGAVTLLRRRRSRYAGGGVVTHRSRAIEVLTHRVGVSIYLVNT